MKENKAFASYAGKPCRLYKITDVINAEEHWKTMKKSGVRTVQQTAAYTIIQKGCRFAVIRM
jgi:hypothetical protein